MVGLSLGTDCPKRYKLRLVNLIVLAMLPYLAQSRKNIDAPHYFFH